MGGRTFECLDAVINRYRKEQIVEGHTLQYGLPAEGTAERQETITTPAERGAEKIYATLRECRDQAGLKKARGIRQQGYLHRRSEKGAGSKKWKLLWMVLMVEGSDAHLYFYESPKRTKPKGLIDLSCAYLYRTHDSLWERPFCLQLVERALPCLATVTHLAARSADEASEWWNALRAACAPQLARSPAARVARLRELRALTLHVIDGHRYVNFHKKSIIIIILFSF